LEEGSGGGVWDHGDGTKIVGLCVHVEVRVIKKLLRKIEGPFVKV